MEISTPQTDFDIVIVGASFAGLTCARAAALRGLRVAVIERKAEPGARVSSTGILVKEAADELDLPGALTREVRGVRLYAPSMRFIDLRSPGYYFFTTDTPGLLRWLAREAERAGARLLYGMRFEGAGHDGADRIGISGLDVTAGHRIAVTARYLIGADGAKSSVARAFGLGRNRRFLVGLEAEYDGDCGIDDGFLHCFLDRRIAPGYIGWIVPGVGITQAGLACRPPNKPDHDGFLDKIASIARLSDRQPIAQRSGLVPAGGLVAPLATERVLLIGDAAGLVFPLTGGGIHNAFRFGRRSGQAVSDYLLGRGPEPCRVLAKEYPKYPIKAALRGLMDLNPPDWAVNLLLETRAMRRLAEHIYFHRRGLALEGSRSKYFKPLSARLERPETV